MDADDGDQEYAQLISSCGNPRRLKQNYINMLDDSIRIQQAHVQMEQYFGSDFSAVSSSELSVGGDHDDDAD